jgi:hypothetical protein
LARSVTDLAIGLDATVGPDPADPATAILDGVRLPRFVESLDPSALRGARLGALTSSFGQATEDEQSGGIVRAALARMGERGATVVYVEIDGIDTLVSGSSVIRHEFKFDFMDYLAATPEAGVRSLDDVLERGLYHAALERSFRRQNRVESRDSDAYRASLGKRVLVQDALRQALVDHELDALVYPTIRRKAARIGDRQRGSNCQLSAASGFPALSLPAGFTSDGIPVGLEMMGLPLTDVRLVALAYAFEQADSPRRAPDFTPPLVDERAPAPVEHRIASEGTVRLSGRLAFDWSTGILAYDLEIAGVAASDVVGVFLHRGSLDSAGPVVQRLMESGRALRSGEVTLGAIDRAAFESSGLYLQVLTRAGAQSVVRVQLGGDGRR